MEDIASAFGCLEIARVLYEEQVEKAGDAQEKKRLALLLSEVHLSLGDLGLDGEEKEQAISDFRAAIVLRQKHLQPSDRLIAEGHLLLGLALQALRDYERAKPAYESAIEVLKLALREQEEKLGPSAGRASLDEGPAEEQVLELQAFLEELNQKLQEVDAFISVLEKKRPPPAAAAEGSGSSLSFDAPAFGPNTDVNDLSACIVKRPRKM